MIHQVAGLPYFGYAIMKYVFLVVSAEDNLYLQRIQLEMRK